MYSTRQRDLRERRIHQRADEYPIAVEVAIVEADDVQEFESPSWGIHLPAPATAA